MLSRNNIQRTVTNQCLTFDLLGLRINNVEIGENNMQRYKVVYDLRRVKDNLLTQKSQVFHSFSEATNFIRSIKGKRMNDSEVYGTPTIEMVS